jgi:hypothetical protein
VCVVASAAMMRTRVVGLLPFLCIAILLLVPLRLLAQINVTTNRYDQARTGANLVETKLTPANVTSSTFGLLYSYPVDGAVYAQPLYVSAVTVNGVRRNVLYVATMNDKVYAFDADSPSATPLWMRDFTNPPTVTAVAMKDILPVNTGNIIGNIGVQGTPVIDPATQTMYLVARTKENDAFVQRLHALDITTGSERTGSPRVISGSVPGNSADSTLVGSERVITFNPKMQMQRPGLALANGVVLVAWATHEDMTPSHGWIMGYDAATLAQVATFAVVRDSYLGGIWQGGRAPALDAAGNAYFATGNGKWDGMRNFGDSVLKFKVAKTGMTLLDFFTPGNEIDLKNNDDDLSGSGFTLLPGTNLLVGGGKEGVLYLLDANNLGKKVTNDTQIPQKIAVNGGHVMGGPVYWNSATVGSLVYNWSESDVLLAYRFVTGKLVTPPYAQGAVMSPGHPGGSLTLSANGSAADSGIIWASMPTSQDVKHIIGAGTLRAFNAETLAEIWNSDRVSSRDRLGNLMKFVPPVVANGNVYLPNHDNAVRVYGLLQVTPPGNGLVAAGDAYVRGGLYAGTNFGTEPELLSKLSSPDEFTRVTYIKFDLGSVASASRAVLRLTGHLSSTANTNVKVDIHGVPDTSWGETTLTWNAKPALGSILGTFTVSGTTAQTLDLDITSFVQAEKQAGHRFVAVGLSNPTATNAYAAFSSREAGGSGPQLMITPEPTTPYTGTPVAAPGTIQFENYDAGGSSVAYFDTTSDNTGNAYRHDNVDIQLTTDTGGGYNLGWVRATEWLKYTVAIAASGTYTIDVRVASNGAGGTFHIEVDGVDKTGTIAVPNTGGWQTWRTITTAGVSLASGSHVIRVVMDTNGATGAVGNLNWFTVRST